MNCTHYISPQIFNFCLCLKNVSKNLSKCLTIYIIIIFVLFFQKSDCETLLWSLCWCQRNLFHPVVIDNEWFRLVWNLKKAQLLRKCIWILVLLWKWIKYIYVLFVLKRCLELGVLLWNQLELLYSLRRKIGAWPPGALFS